MPPAGVVPLKEQETVTKEEEEIREAWNLTLEEEMDMDPEEDAALAQQADLAMTRQQQEQPTETDTVMDHHATRLAAALPGMLAHMPIRQEPLPTTILEAMNEEEGQDEQDGGEEKAQQEQDRARLGSARHVVHPSLCGGLDLGIGGMHNKPWIS